MDKSKKTRILCYDDRNSFSHEIKKLFPNSEKYNVISFHNKNTFVDYCRQSNNGFFSNIGIIGFVESTDKIQMLNEFLTEIQETVPDIRFIILTQQKNIGQVFQEVKENTEGIFPINNNMPLRISNCIKRIISECNIQVAAKKRNRALLSVMFFLIFCIISFIMLQMH